MVQRKENSEYVKVARLQHEHSKWISASSLVLTVYLTVVLTVVIAFVFGVNEFAKFAYMLMLMLMHMAIIIVSALGLAFGVVRNFAKKSMLSMTLLWSRRSLTDRRERRHSKRKSPGYLRPGLFLCGWL